MGWPVASKLMQRWVDGAAWTVPDPVKLGKTNAATLPVAQVDETTVSMSWLLKFARAKAAQQLAVSRALSPAAIVLLKQRLADAGWTSGAFTLGNTGMSARTLERACQTNFAPVGALEDTIDEFYGAIGKASFKVAVVGSVAPAAKNQHVFNVSNVGVYLRDTYDFTDTGFISQPLGIWSKKRCLTKAEMGLYAADQTARLTNPLLKLLPALYPGFEAVYNSDFDDWRTANSKGGDFVIYSDVQWLAPTVAQAQVPL